MKPRQIEFLLRLAVVVTVTVRTTTGAPISLKDPIASRDEMIDEKQSIRVQKVIGTCLQIAPDLPACNFDSDATWLSRSGEIPQSDSAGSSYPMGELPDFLADGSQGDGNLAVGPNQLKDGSSTSNDEKNLEEFPSNRSDLAITVVYYLEGCLPARLPFDLPSCPIDKLRTIEMNRLVPFQLPDLKDAVIFPEIDIKQIEFSHRQSRAHPASQSHENVEENRDGIGFDGSASGRKSTLGFLTGNENVESSTKGVQDFHNKMLKSNTMPRTGTASAKYVIKQLPGSDSTSIASGSPSAASMTKKEKVSSHFWKTNPKMDLEIEGARGMKEDVDISVEGKNRVQ